MTSYARAAELLIANAESILDRENYRGDRYADAQAVATIALIALMHAVLAVADAIDAAAGDVADRAAVISR